MSTRIPDPASAQLVALLGDRFSTSASVRDLHGRDESPLPPAAPDAVAFATSTAEVSEILKVCSAHRVPVIPFGAGTSLEGHVLPTRGGVSLDLNGLDRIIAVRPDDLDVTVQAGVTRKQLDERLRREGLFFPVDPGADATIGGMIATGASGTTTVRYGAMRENVLSIEVVLADGQVIRTGHRARKSSAGYDLTRLLVGSEGTLGVVTEATLRIYGVPEAISAAVCHFSGIEDAVRTVITTLQTGIPVARVELLDENQMAAVNEFSGLSYPAAPSLFFEFHGSPSGVAEQATEVASIASDNDPIEVRTAVAEQERAKLWRARHDAYYASRALRPGSSAITTDVCVPISALGRCILETAEDVERAGLTTTTTVGHVGDGNFHLMMMFDPDDEAEARAADEVNHRLLERALALEGTITGEHGVGSRKVGFMGAEFGDAVAVMRAIKQALDPDGILNPGKVLPPASSV